MRRLRVAERALLAVGLLLITVYLGARGYGELMRRRELRRFAAARERVTATAREGVTAPVRERVTASAREGVTSPARASGDQTDALSAGQPLRDAPATFEPSAGAMPGTTGPALHLPATVDTRLWSAQRIRHYEDSLGEETGLPLAVLRIRRLDIEVPVLEGLDEVTLNRGAGHIQGTALPGEAGNVGIAGHRDGFFRGIKDVHLGDVLELEALDGTADYVVEDIRIVNPDEVSVLRPTPSPTITLVTCYPFYYVGPAPQRYIVRARRAQPAPPAGSPH